MAPVLPGSTWRLHSPAVVQPHEGWTLVRMSNSSPVLVKMNVYLTGSPDLTLPKSYTGVWNWILGPIAPMVTGVGVAGAGTGAGGACWAQRNSVPAARRQHTKVDFAVIIFITVCSFCLFSRRACPCLEATLARPERIGQWPTGSIASTE